MPCVKIKLPDTVMAIASCTVLPDVFMVKLLNTVADGPAMVCVALPLNITVPVPSVNVPLLVKLPATCNVPVVKDNVPTISTLPVTVMFLVLQASVPELTVRLPSMVSAELRVTVFVLPHVMVRPLNVIAPVTVDVLLMVTLQRLDELGARFMVPLLVMLPLTVIALVAESAVLGSNVAPALTEKVVFTVNVTAPVLPKSKVPEVPPPTVSDLIVVVTSRVTVVPFEIVTVEVALGTTPPVQVVVALQGPLFAELMAAALSVLNERVKRIIKNMPINLLCLFIILLCDEQKVENAKGELYLLRT